MNLSPPMPQLWDRTREMGTVIGRGRITTLSDRQLLHRHLTHFLSLPLLGWCSFRYLWFVTSGQCRHTIILGNVIKARIRQGTISTYPSRETARNKECCGCGSISSAWTAVFICISQQEDVIFLLFIRERHECWWTAQCDVNHSLMERTRRNARLVVSR